MIGALLFIVGAAAGCLLSVALFGVEPATSLGVFTGSVVTYAAFKLGALS